ELLQRRAVRAQLLDDLSETARVVGKDPLEDVRRSVRALALEHREPRLVALSLLEQRHHLLRVHRWLRHAFPRRLVRAVLRDWTSTLRPRAATNAVARSAASSFTSADQTRGEHDPRRVLRAPCSVLAKRQCVWSASTAAMASSRR